MHVPAGDARMIEPAPQNARMHHTCAHDARHAREQLPLESATALSEESIGDDEALSRSSHVRGPSS
jgi:hypothetical protein